MIEICKILSGKYDIAVIPIVNRIWNLTTTGNNLRLQKGHVEYDCRNITFNNVVWNSLPNHVKVKIRGLI